VLYIVRNFRTRPTHLTTYWDNIRGIFNPALINRVNKLITNNIKSTYNCHTFLESSGQVHLTIHRVNIWGFIDSVPKYSVNLVYFDPTSKKGSRNLFSVARDLYALVSPIVFVKVTWFCFIKSLIIKTKLIVEVKVVTNLNRA